MEKPFDKGNGRILLESVDGFWKRYKPWKESCDKYEKVFDGTNVGHLLNQTAFQWLYVLTERYGWKHFVASQKRPIKSFPATSAIQLIGNCIKHHGGNYEEEHNKTWVPGFKIFCNLNQPWMQGKNVDPPLKEFIIGNPINLSTVARAKNQLKVEIINSLPKDI